MTPIQRSLTAFALASINQPHMVMLGEQGVDISPYQKLLQKQKSFLSGELKSEANLLRFFEQFSEWRQQQQLDSNLNERIADLCCAALYSSIEMLHDSECDDIALLNGFVAQLYDEMDELGGDSQPLRQYFADLQEELSNHIKLVTQRPVKKELFIWLSEQDTSLFGLSS